MRQTTPTSNLDIERLQNGTALTPFALGIPETCHFMSLGDRTVRRLLADGKLRAVKSGTKTLILTESVLTYLSALPAAQFRAKAA